jgi:hypothetical protein
MSSLVSGPVGAGGYLPEGARVGFVHEDKEVQATRGVKIKSKTSIAKEEEDRKRKEIASNFEARTDKYLEHHDNKARRSIEVSKKFIMLSEDKTLAENKSTINEEVERDIRKDFIQLGIDLNNDETEEGDGMGSIALITVLSKVILNQRDRINNLEYAVESLLKQGEFIGKQFRELKDINKKLSSRSPDDGSSSDDG